MGLYNNRSDRGSEFSNDDKLYDIRWREARMSHQIKCLNNIVLSGIKFKVGEGKEHQLSETARQQQQHRASDIWLRKAVKSQLLLDDPFPLCSQGVPSNARMRCRKPRHYYDISCC